MKIATWNVNSLKVRLPHLLALLNDKPVDVIALQETKTQDPDFPVDELAAAGYSVAFSGQKSYNGVALLARQPLALEDVSMGISDFNDEQKRVIAATVNGVRVIGVYVPNGQSLESEKYRYKLDWLAALREHMKRELATHSKLVILGDYNIAPRPEDTHDPAVWEGQILCSEPERAAFRGLLDLGLEDLWHKNPHAVTPFTWWDYRQAGFRRNLGLRIDHILASAELAERCGHCDVDVEPRKLERPSDHAPVIAEFNL